MKKLICAAAVAASMFAMADEAAKPAAAPAATAVTARSPRAAANRPKISEERLAKMREQRMKYMAERKAKMAAQMLEVVKKYVPEEEKAKALVDELQEAMKAGRRNMMRSPRPKAAKPAATK